MRRVAIEDDEVHSYGLDVEPELVLDDDDEYDDLDEQWTDEDWWQAYGNLGVGYLDPGSPFALCDDEEDAYAVLHAALLDLGWSHAAIAKRADRRDADLAPAEPSIVPPAVSTGGARLDESHEEGLRDRLHDAGSVLGHRVNVPPRKYEDSSNEPATRWMRENDPLRTPEGVAEAVEAALAAAGLTREGVRLVFRRGKPSAAQQEARARLREALEPLTGITRELVADALGCSPDAVRRLLPR